MPSGPKTYAFNRTRQAYLATDLSVAETHWSRFCGLMLKDASNFQKGQGLWIVPSRGVHTFAMRFSIDVVYLDKAKRVVHLEPGLNPGGWLRSSCKQRRCWSCRVIRWVPVAPLLGMNWRL